MKEYVFSYFREQRVYGSVFAEDEIEAENLVEDLIPTFNLDSEDDESDDPGDYTLHEKGFDDSKGNDQ